MKTLPALAALSALALLAACGQYGPLRLPEPKPASSAPTSPADEPAQKSKTSPAP